jgi:hypothetical protein
MSYLIPSHLVPARLSRVRRVLRSIATLSLHSNHLHPYTREFLIEYGSTSDIVLFNQLLETADILGHKLLEPVAPIPV